MSAGLEFISSVLALRRHPDRPHQMRHAARIHPVSRRFAHLRCSRSATHLHHSSSLYNGYIIKRLHLASFPSKTHGFARFSRHYRLHFGHSKAHLKQKETTTTNPQRRRFRFWIHSWAWD